MCSCLNNATVPLLFLRKCNCNISSVSVFPFSKLSPQNVNCNWQTLYILQTMCARQNYICCGQTINISGIWHWHIFHAFLMIYFKFTTPLLFNCFPNQGCELHHQLQCLQISFFCFFLYKIRTNLDSFYPFSDLLHCMVFTF